MAWQGDWQNYNFDINNLSYMTLHDIENNEEIDSYD